MIFLDTETCGLHGPIVLIQWAEDDGPVNLHSIWNEPVYKTMELIEEICFNSVCGFNLAFDWFHICQLYTTLSLLPKNEPPDVTQYALKEPEARDGFCLKPESACDVMIHARKGKYQSTMNRKPIRVKKVPTALAWDLADELSRRIEIDEIYFAGYSDPRRRWQVQDLYDNFGDVIPDFKDLTLTFQPTSALKALAKDALGIDDPTLFGEIGLDKYAQPNELGYAPFALAIGKPGNWNKAWPMVIEQHISHWSYNPLAREYAEKDVIYTRDLWKHFGRPEPGDVDSDLACMVGAVRWKGFEIDVDNIKKLKQESIRHINKLKEKFNFESSAACRTYMEQVLDESEKAVLRQNEKITTKAVVLEQIAKWTNQEVCKDCQGMGCKNCEDGLVKGNDKHPAAIRAREILDARHAKKELEIYEKLLTAGRFHASFTVTGTFTNRMSGGDGLNPQGIKRSDYVRQAFPLATPPLILCGGDFSSFEVSIADAVYADPKLHSDLMSGKKIHALFGEELFPGKTHDEIVQTKHDATTLEEDLYTRAKNCVFAMLYGGEEYTLQTRGNISEEVATRAYQGWLKRYPTWDKERKKYADMFCSMKQPGGIGTKVEWHEPADYIEAMFGFRRYFTVENKICKELFKLANDPPDYFKQKKFKVKRRDREQTAHGAVSSALYAAAFALQASNMRAAGNHVIQNPGAEMTKKLQHCLWQLQPVGINRWRVQPMNIHDEVLAPMLQQCIPQAEKIVQDFIEEHKKYVPLLEIEWKTNIPNWAGK